jgi:hypothetical protein
MQLNSHIQLNSFAVDERDILKRKIAGEPANGRFLCAF